MAAIRIRVDELRLGPPHLVNLVRDRSTGKPNGFIDVPGNFRASGRDAVRTARTRW